MRRVQLPPAGPLVFEPQAARPGPRLSWARAQAESGLGPQAARPGPRLSQARAQAEPGLGPELEEPMMVPGHPEARSDGT